MADPADRRGVDQEHHQQKDRQRHSGCDGKLARRQRPGIRSMNARGTHQHRNSRGHIGGAAAQRTLPRTAVVIDAVGRRHGFSAERNTVSITGRPMLML